MTTGRRTATSRREFLTALAGAVVVAGAGGAVFASTRTAGAHTATGGATTSAPPGSAVPASSPHPTAQPPSHPPASASHAPPTHPAPGHPGTGPAVETGASSTGPSRGSTFGSGVHQVSGLPPGPPRIALTVDDGDDSAVLGAFIAFARDSGVRLTFFPNGVYDGWTEHKAALAPLIESGQAQVGNHTWSHPKLTTLTDAEVADQIRRNDTFLRSTFGVNAAPYFRPPYGFHDARTDAVASDLGYHAITLWDGVFDDSSSHLTGSQIVANARDCFTAGRIVLGHANHPPVTTVYGQLLDIIRSRRLQTVTLADVYGH